MTKEIIKEFFERFSDRPTSSAWYQDVERFIIKALALQKKELLEKIEEMKRDYDGKTWQDCKTTEQYVEMTELFSYNQALEDLKKLLA